MTGKEEIQRIQEFLGDLEGLCKEYDVRIHNAAGVSFEVGETPVWVEKGFKFGPEPLVLEVGPIWDPETVLYVRKNPPAVVVGVFNSAGVCDPLPCEPDKA